MKDGSIIVACVSSGIAVTPFAAHHFRPRRMFFDATLDQWFVSALRTGEDFQVLVLTALVCGLGGLLAGMLLPKLIAPSKNNKRELSLYRTPLAAAILIPIGIGTMLVFAYNHTLQVLDGIVWPAFYFQNVFLHSIVIGVAGAIIAVFLNICEQSFQDSNVIVKLGITCCLPLAIAVGLASLAGMIGGGLLSGVAVGQFFGCPISCTWAGGCLGIALLATQSGVFWPAYFPLAAQGGK